MRLVHRLLLLCVVFPFLGSALASAQNPERKPRILGKIDENQLVTLKGNVHPAAIAKNDLGPVQSNLAMNGLVLVLSRSPEQQAAFDEFVASQYDATSPNYHHWLLPTQIGEQFGPSLTDIATASNWLSSHGFAVSQVSKDRMSIEFSGSAAQVESAFHTEIHNLSVNGVRHIANMSDPQIPVALAPVVVGVKALHNFTPKPLHRVGGTATLDSQSGGWRRIALPQTLGKGTPSPDMKLRPNFGITVGSGANAYQVEDVTPFDFATIYNVQPLWNAATPINGTGQTIAIVGTSDINLSDVATFRSTFGLPAGLTPIEVKGGYGTDPGICTAPANSSALCTIEDLTENSLDVEWSGAVAPGAQVVLVTTAQTASNDPIQSAAQYIIDQYGVPSSPLQNAHILSVSYGLCELGMGSANNSLYNRMWETAASSGIAVFVATGDAGSAACDQGQDTTVPYEAQYGVSVSGIASTPYDTAVGGTDLNWGATASPYWNTTNAATGASANGYMPEVPWNDTCTNPLALSYLQSWATELNKNGYHATSPTDAETACQFVITWYQTIAQNTNPTVDLSGFVDVAGGGGGASNCINGDGSTVASCTQGYPKPSWQAGVTGIPSDGVRDIPDVSFFAANGFLGSSYLICVSDVAPCTYSTTTEPVALEVGGTSVSTPAMAGVMALINQKATAPQGNPNTALYALAATQTYASCSTETVTTSSSCYFNDIDAGSASFAGTNEMACQPGTPNCTVAHSGDTVAVLSGYSSTTGFDLATGLGSLNVANVVNALAATPATGLATPAVTVTPSATSLSVNQALTVTVAVSGSSGTATGTVTLKGGGYLGSAQTLSSGGYSVTLPAFSLTSGTDVLVAAYSGDSNYQEGAGNATVTVSKVAPAGITVTPSSTSFAANAAVTVTGTVSAATGGPTPTGTVTLSAGTYTSAATALSSGNYSIMIPASTFSAGAVTLTATYSGDNTYSSISNTAAVTVTAPVIPPSYSLSASATTAVAPGSAATSTITATGSNGYAGSVALSCALTTSPTGASDLPTCSFGTGNPITLSATTTTGTVTVSVTTTAATSGALVRPSLRRNNELTLAGLGGAALALLALFGVPRQRRAFRSMLGMLAFVLMLGGLAACGGGGGSSSGGGGSGGGGTSNPGTTAGTYTFTLSGTGSDTAKTTASTTFTVTVN